MHLHAPGTKLNDQFRVDYGDVWSEYCRKLHESDVVVFGITDYFSADGYFHAIAEFDERYPDSEKLFLPNIELRTGDVVNRAQEEVNTHILFNPFRSDYKTKIWSFLQALKTNKTKSEGRRNIRASELTEKHHFEEATTTREFIREALEETYGRDADLLDYLLIITAANNDGIRPERGKKRKLLITDEIDKFSDGFFGNAANVDYYLDCKRGEDKSEHFDPKPVLSGCDAHSLDELDERLGQVVSNMDGIVLEPTWIKADLTFEGLKQIIFEPQNRVLICEEPEIERRVRENKTKYIDALHVTCIDEYQGQHGIWFDDEEILLGKELVAIIGNKGSGKSAVTDIIGLLGNSHNQTSESSSRNPDELFSFLNSEKFLKRGCAKNFSGTLTWYDGTPDQKTLNDKIVRNLPEKVEYLPQKYLERVCANIADDEFRATLNEVIFRYVKDAQRYRQTNLDDLIAYMTQQANEDIVNAKHLLHLANEKVVSVEKKLVTDYQIEIKERIRLKNEELDAHKSIRPPEKPKPADEDSTATGAVEIEKLTQEIADCNETISQLVNEQNEVNSVAQELRQIRQAIEREARGLNDLKSQYGLTLESTGLSFDDIVKLEINYSKLDALISDKGQRYREIDDLLVTSQDIAERFRDKEEDDTAIEAAKAKSIVCKKASLQEKKIQLVERQDKPAREYQDYLTLLEIWASKEKEICGDEQNPAVDSLRGLEKELENISTNYPAKFQAERAEQIRFSKSVFQKKKNLTQLYDAIKQSIDAEIAKCRDDLGDYSISIEVGLRFDPDFIDKFLGYINQGKKGSFYGTEEGRAMLCELCEAVDDWENENEIFGALDAMVDALHFDRRSDLPDSEDEARNIFKQMKNQEEPVVELYDYLYGFDYLIPKYDLKVDQKDLSELSPGERGGLLLIFYLMLDRQDIPLIIDQPEDNLDNKSVYEILVTFIKQAKKRRQIVLVTHNPNLAVVADAEQIVHVSIDKKESKHEFDFFSGSIENPRINQAVVDILEGTLPAFDNRRLKYRRPTQRLTSEIDSR